MTDQPTKRRKTYVEFLKQNEPMDDYILFLLAAQFPLRNEDTGYFVRDKKGRILTRQFSVNEIAQMCGVTRPTVYNCIMRHYGLFQNYINNPDAVQLVQKNRRG